MSLASRVMVDDIWIVYANVCRRGPNQRNMSRPMMQPFRSAINKPVKSKLASARTILIRRDAKNLLTLTRDAKSDWQIQPNRARPVQTTKWYPKNQHMGTRIEGVDWDILFVNKTRNSFRSFWIRIRKSSKPITHRTKLFGKQRIVEFEEQLGDLQNWIWNNLNLQAIVQASRLLVLATILAGESLSGRILLLLFGLWNSVASCIWLASRNCRSFTLEGYKVQRKHFSCQHFSNSIVTLRGCGKHKLSPVWVRVAVISFNTRLP